VVPQFLCPLDLCFLPPFSSFGSSLVAPAPANTSAWENNTSPLLLFAIHLLGNTGTLFDSALPPFTPLKILIFLALAIAYNNYRDQRLPVRQRRRVIRDKTKTI